MPQAQGAPAKEAPREAVDPVCGMSVSVAGARHTAEVLGTIYYFCCAGCRATFLAEPARFLGASKAVRS
jgi:Cu+-exporting ATPase